MKKRLVKITIGAVVIVITMLVAILVVNGNNVETPKVSFRNITKEEVSVGDFYELSVMLEDGCSDSFNLKPEMFEISGSSLRRFERDAFGGYYILLKAEEGGMSEIKFLPSGDKFEFEVEGIKAYWDEVYRGFGVEGSCYVAYIKIENAPINFEFVPEMLEITGVSNVFSIRREGWWGGTYCGHSYSVHLKSDEAGTSKLTFIPSGDSIEFETLPTVSFETPYVEADVTRVTVTPSTFHYLSDTKADESTSDTKAYKPFKATWEVPAEGVGKSKFYYVKLSVEEAPVLFELTADMLESTGSSVSGIYGDDGSYIIELKADADIVGKSEIIFLPTGDKATIDIH